MGVIETTGFKVGHSVEFITNRLPATAGTYLAGDLLQKNATTGNFEKCTLEANFCAIAVEDSTVTTDGNAMAVYLTGMFDLEKLPDASTFDEVLLRNAGRVYNIFFAETK